MLCTLYTYLIEEIFSEDWDVNCREVFKNENKCKEAKLKTVDHSERE